MRATDHPRLQDVLKAEQDGRVQRAEHDGLVSFRYTRDLHAAGDWCPITLAARGIIFCAATGAVVARPFDKFFNYGEFPESMGAVPGGDYVVEEKLDGSLGIVFWWRGRWRVATRGSFDSEQALRGEALLSRYRLDRAPRTHTILVEIIYPEHRIVVDYGTHEGLTLLALRHKETGVEDRPEPWADVLGIPARRVFPSTAIDELTHDENTEGYVVRWDDGTRLKVKSPKYVRVHRLLEYCSPKRILEMIRAGQYDEIRKELPVGIVEQFDDIAAELHRRVVSLEREAHRALREHGELARRDRGEFARTIQNEKPATKTIVFTMLDGRDERPTALKLLAAQLKREAARQRS